jgi:putative tricarboxylic transport membrane protein
MQAMNREQQVAGGLGLFAVIYLIGAWRLPRFALGTAVIDAYVFPLVLGGILLLLSILYFIQSRGLKFDKALLDGVDKPLLLKLIGSCLLYALVLGTLGFLIATTLFLMLGMYLMGRRKWATLASVSIGFSIVTYTVFVYVLGVPLAQGILPF